MTSKWISFMGFSGMDLASRISGTLVGGLNGYVLYDYASQRPGLSVSSIITFMGCGFLKPVTTMLVSSAALGVVRNIHQGDDGTTSVINISWKQV